MTPRLQAVSASPLLACTHARTPPAPPQVATGVAVSSLALAVAPAAQAAQEAFMVAEVRACVGLAWWCCVLLLVFGRQAEK